MKRAFIAAVVCSLLLTVSSVISVEAQTSSDWSVTWDSSTDWGYGTYQNARVKDGSVDIGIYPPDPHFTGTEWSFFKSIIVDVDVLEAKYEGGKAYFYSRDSSGFGGEIGRAIAYAMNTFYLDSAGIDGATLGFGWKGYSTDFNQGDGTTTLYIQLQKPGETGWQTLWVKTFDTPSGGTEGTETVGVSASTLNKSGNYTMRIYVDWYFDVDGWNDTEKFAWYVDDISFGLKTATHTTHWKNIGATSAWKTLEAGVGIGSGQSITALVQVSDDGAAVKGTKTVSLSNGTKSYGISNLPDARYVRIVSSLTTSSMANTPRLDKYKVTADPLPTLASGDITPTTGPPNTTFTYTVTYTDLDGDEPSSGYPKVYIDGTGYEMTKISGTYTSGATYRFITATLGQGSHGYYFRANDGTSTVRLPASGDYSGPTTPGGEEEEEEEDEEPTPGPAPPALPWEAVAVILIVGGVAGATALVWKTKSHKPKPVKHVPKVKPSEPKPVKPVGRFCPHCKTKLPADAAFCPECGRKFKR